MAKGYWPVDSRSPLEMPRAFPVYLRHLRALVDSTALAYTQVEEEHSHGLEDTDN